VIKYADGRTGRTIKICSLYTLHANNTRTDVPTLQIMKYFLVSVLLLLLELIYAHTERASLLRREILTAVTKKNKIIYIVSLCILVAVYQNSFGSTHINLYETTRRHIQKTLFFNNISGMNYEELSFTAVLNCTYVGSGVLTQMTMKTSTF
jgi:hypothetical protein